MWEEFKKYCDIRTNFLKLFIEKAGINYNFLPSFLKLWEETGSVLKSWISYEDYSYSFDDLTKETLEKYKDYIEDWDKDPSILKCLRELFPDMMRSNYNVKNLEIDVNNFSPLAIKEFYDLIKGKYYVGQDLDEDLGNMGEFVKDQSLIEEYKDKIIEYFKLRYLNYDLSLLCEYSSLAFGVHESRQKNFVKTGMMEFDLPRECYKYPVKELVDKYLKNINISGTRIINIRGTNGSGKTTMVNNTYKNNKSIEHTFTLTDSEGKEHIRYYDELPDKKLILLGGYNSPYNTKGVDRLGDVYEIIQGVLEVVNKYPGWTIIMESATVSTSFWAYATLFMILKKYGVQPLIITLFVHNWNWVISNIRNRVERKEGKKEPNYEGITDKRYILYKNYFRFTSLLGEDNNLIIYSDDYNKEEFNLSVVMK